MLTKCNGIYLHTYIHIIILYTYKFDEMKERKKKTKDRKEEIYIYMAATEKNLSLKSFSSQFDENIETICKRDRRIQKNHEGKEKKKGASSTSSKTVAAFKRFQML